MKRVWGLLCLLGLAACSSGDSPGAVPAPPPPPDNSATTAAAPAPTSSLVFTDEEKQEAARLAAGLKGHRLPNDTPDGVNRRRALLHLLGENNDPKLLGAAFEALRRKRLAGWEPEEQKHLEVELLRMLGTEELRAIAASRALVFASTGSMPESLTNAIVKLAASDAPVWDRFAAFKTMREIHPVPAGLQPVVLKAIDDTEAQVRFEAANAAGATIEPDTFWSIYAKPLLKLFDDPNKVVRVAVARAFSNMHRGWGKPMPAAGAQAREGILKMVGDDNPLVRCWGLVVLSEYGEAQDLKRVGELLNDKGSCRKDPPYKFYDRPKGQVRFSLRPRFATTVSFAAMYALWHLSPADNRPPMLGEGDDFKAKDRDTKKLLPQVQAWHAANKAKL